MAPTRPVHELEPGSNWSTRTGHGTRPSCPSSLASATGIVATHETSPGGSDTTASELARGSPSTVPPLLAIQRSQHSRPLSTGRWMP
eukprot:4700195-Amphidinium_carterae.1